MGFKNKIGLQFYWNIILDYEINRYLQYNLDLMSIDSLFNLTTYKLNMYFILMDGVCRLPNKTKLILPWER